MLDKKIRKSYFIQAEWQARSLKNVVTEFLVDPKDVFLPPPHIKLGLIDNFVMNREGQALKYLREKITRLCDAKVRGGISIEPHIRLLVLDSEFDLVLDWKAKEAYVTLKGVMHGFLLNERYYI